MLVLRREWDQAVIVEHAGELLRIVVVEIVSANAIRLGFDDPTKEFKVLREELIKSENDK